MIRVLVCDDNAVVRHGLTAVLDDADDISVVAVAGDGAEAIEAARRTSPDVAVLDVRMPGTDGITAAAALASRCSVLMLTFSDDDEVVVAALRAGARGFLVHGQHEPAELVAAVRRVHRDEAVLGPRAADLVLRTLRDLPNHQDLAHRHQLTPREAEVMDELARGRSNAEIAAALHVARKTVKNHLNNAYAKLGVGSRAEAIALWLGARPG